MKETKFRAWDIVCKCWRYSNINGLAEFFKAVEEGDLINVEEFTGLKDKNGKDIYDGDIGKDNIGLFEIKFGIHLWHDPDGYEQEALGFYGLWKDKSGHRRFKSRDNFEIIGNIWENPELLERK